MNLNLSIMLTKLCAIFFFSSRRRHTRYASDWSSDVCSSDLFFLCQPADVTANGCESGGTKVGATKTLANGSASSDATANTTAIGKYCWRAEYSGDGFYNPSSHTNSTSECFTTAKLAPTVATVIHAGPGAADTADAPAITTALPASIAHDSATV